MEKTLFDVGDLIQTYPDRNHDNMPHFAIIIKAIKTQGIDSYIVFFPDGYGGKSAWYSNDELQLVFKPDYKNAILHNYTR